MLNFLLFSLSVLTWAVIFLLLGHIICRFFAEPDEDEEESEGSLNLKIYSKDFKISGKIMALTLTSTQQVKGTLEPLDALGRPAKVEDGSASFTSSDESVFTVEVDPEDPLTVTIKAVGEGVAQLDYSADADLGDGVTTIAGFAAVEVLPAQAVGFGIVFGAPEEQELPDGGTSTTTSTTTTQETTEEPVEPIV